MTKIRDYENEKTAALAKRVENKHLELTAPRRDTGVPSKPMKRVYITGGKK